MAWYEHPSVWIFAAGLVAQAAITWAAVRGLEKRSADQEARLRKAEEFIARLRGKLNLNGGGQ